MQRTNRTRELIAPVTHEVAARVYAEAYGHQTTVHDVVPNSMCYMARDPELVAAMAPLVKKLFLQEGRVPRSLKHLVGYVTSMAAGCQYCAVHQARTAA